MARSGAAHLIIQTNRTRQEWPLFAPFNTLPTTYSVLLTAYPYGGPISVLLSGGRFSVVTDTVLADTTRYIASFEVTRAAATSRPRVGALQPRAFKFLAALPPGLRPLKTGEKYPRIVNQLALLNGAPAGFDIYLDELLIDSRGNRQGFPQDVADELYRLRTFCEVAVCPAREVCEVMNVAAEVSVKYAREPKNM